MFYIDKNGCITFSTGACVTDYFRVDEDFKILVTSNIVNKFRLFSQDVINWKIGTTDINGNKVNLISMEDDFTTVVSMINMDNDLIDSVPVDVIRNMAYDEYKYNLSINRLELLGVINRLSIFNNDEIKYNFHEQIKEDMSSKLIPIIEKGFSSVDFNLKESKIIVLFQF